MNPLLPFSWETEVSMLSSILMNNAVVLELDLIADHFYGDSNRKFFQIIAQLLEEGYIADVATVAVEVEHRNWQNLISPEFVRDISMMVSTAANAPHYYKILEEYRHKRNNVTAVYRLLGVAEGDGDSGDFLLAMDRTAARIREDIIEAPKGLSTPSDYHDKIRTLWAGGETESFATGWPNLDRMFPIIKGQMTVVTGIPNHGKSAFVSALSMRMMQSHGWHCAFFSPESHPLEKFCGRLLALESGIPFYQIPEGRRDQHESFLERHVTFLEPEIPTIDSLIHLAGKLVRQKSLDLIVFDPWNEITHNWPSHKTETHYISEALSKIRAFARINGIHAFIIAHPMKLQKDRDGHYPVPTPYDISGSAHFRNKADNCLTVWRDAMDTRKSVEVHVQKVRENGQVGIVDFSFDSATGRYLDLHL